MLEEKAREFYPIVKSGRTHLQDAVPIRLGQEFGAYAKAIARDHEKIQLAAEGLRRRGIVGAATGTGLNAHPEYHARMVKRLSELCSFPLYESDNLFESMQSMADGNPPDTPYLPPALRQHQKLFGHVPDDLSPDRGFYTPENNALAHQLDIHLQNGP